MRVVVLGVAAVLGSALAGSRAVAQLVSAEACVDADAGVSAADEPGLFDSDSFADGPRTFDVFLASGTIPWDLLANAGGGIATTDGVIQYLATSQIRTRGDFSMFASGMSPAAALVGFDAAFGIAFEVAQPTTFTIAGFVSTTRALGVPEVIACQYNQVKLAGDSRAEPLAAGTYPFSVERTLYPEETGRLECFANSGGGTADSNTLVWDVTIEGLPEPAAALTGLATIGTLGVLQRARPPRS